VNLRIACSAWCLALGLAFFASAAFADPVVLATPLRLSFVPHAAFFSVLEKQPELIDPDVFIAVSGEPPGTFHQLAHAAGIRNARMSDDGTQPARDANGRTLGVDLQRWFSATGLIAFSPPETAAGSVSVAARFANLVPSGRYSLFEVHLENVSGPVTVTPLDGVGTANSFTASPDGSADVSITMPRALQHGEAIALVFHSDGHDHGLKTGDAGIDAEHQMIVRIP